MNFFEMDSLESEPRKNKFPSILGKPDKMKYLKRIVGKFVDKYVLNFEAESSALLSSTESEHQHQPSACDIPSRQEADDGVFNYAYRLLPYGYSLGIFRMLQIMEMENVPVVYGSS